MAVYMCKECDTYIPCILFIDMKKTVIPENCPFGEQKPKWVKVSWHDVIGGGE